MATLIPRDQQTASSSPSELVKRQGRPRHIIFRDCNGDHRNVQLGRVSKRESNRVLSLVKRLVTAQIRGEAPGSDDLQWLRVAANQTVAASIFRLGLLAPRPMTKADICNVEPYYSKKEVRKPYSENEIQTALGASRAKPEEPPIRWGLTTAGENAGQASKE